MKIKQCISPSTVHSEKATAYVAAGTLFKIKKTIYDDKWIKNKSWRLVKVHNLRWIGFTFQGLQVRNAKDEQDSEKERP